jgi:hypothetical protein
MWGCNGSEDFDVVFLGVVTYGLVDTNVSEKETASVFRVETQNSISAEQPKGFSVETHSGRDSVTGFVLLRNGCKEIGH